jgi:Cu(I)-responsive transcriptional regulator
MMIGDAAGASGVSAKIIRHYEAIGLLSPARLANGYRDCAARDVQVLRFIRTARNLGFGLEEIRRLLALWQDRNRASAEVRAIALRHIADLERKAAELSAMAATLRALPDACREDDRPDCPILERLENPE